MERLTQDPDFESDSQEGVILTDLSENKLRLLLLARTPSILEDIAILRQAGTVTRDVLEKEITI